MRIRRILLAAAVLCIAGWLLFAIVGQAAAAQLSNMFGDAIVRLGQGKFSDPRAFVYNRLWEGLWLLTVGVLLAIAMYGLHRLLLVRDARFPWIIEAVAGFVAVNLWFGVAAHTCLFWGLMYTGKSNHNLVQFHFKRLVTQESSKRPQALLLGSSQTQSQIDESLLNQILAGRLWTTELHYPGTRAYDLLLIWRRLASQRPDYVICYLSESYFFNGLWSEGLPCFLRFSDLSDYRRFESYPIPSVQGFGYGLLGDVLPLFRYRDVLAARLFGITLATLSQQQYLARLETDLDSRARQTAPSYQADKQSEFQMAAFDEFLAESKKAGTQVIVCVGQLNPILAQKLSPEVRVRMDGFLKAMQQKYGHLKLIEESALPVQSAAEYEDLTHVKPAAQERFTRHLAEVLERMLPSQRARK